MAEGGEVKDSNGQIESAINPQHQDIFADNPRPNGAVRFDQQLAQPVVNPVVAPDLVVSGPEERSMEASSISAIRMCNWTYMNPQPALRFAQDGLIKIQSSSLSGDPGTLIDFCKFHVCIPPQGLTILQMCTQFVPVEHFSKIMLTSRRSCQSQIPTQRQDPP